MFLKYQSTLVDNNENIKSIDLCGSQNNDNQSKNVKLKDENTSKEQDQAKEIDINQEDGDSQLDKLKKQMEEMSSNSKVDEDLEESETKREIENDVKHESSPPTTRKKVKNRGNTNPGIQECIECGEEFAREMYLYRHLENDDRCMAAMGGSIEEARRYVDSMKKQESFRQNPFLKINQRMAAYKANREKEKAKFKAYHQANKKRVNKKRMDRFENNKETEKANFKAYHEANKEPRQKYFATYHENNKESRQKDFAARYEANKAKSGRYGPIFPCIVCHELHWWSNVDVVNFDDVEDKFLCNEYIVSQNNLFMKLDSYYCCKTCKKKTDGGEMPRVAAVNDMKCPWENTPQFMLKSKVNMVISKCFITIVFSVGS